MTIVIAATAVTVLAKQEGGQHEAMTLVQQYQDGVATRPRETVHDPIAK